MTALRCAEGVNLSYLEQRFGAQQRERVERIAEGWLRSGDLRCEKGWMRIPVERFMISDAVIESLFEV